MSSALAELPLLDPHLVGARHARISAAHKARELTERTGELTVRFGAQGHMFNLSEYLSFTDATSLLVLIDGVVVYRWLATDVSADTLMVGASATKSVLAQLVGRAVEAGPLRLSDRAVTWVPELAGSGYRDVTVGQLLTMTSGVAWQEDYRDPDSPALRLLACIVQPGAGPSRDVLCAVRGGVEPGSRYAYCTADSHVLDWVRERATGHPFAQALQQLWTELGCVRDAVVLTDSAGVAFAGGGLAATPRDWARVGVAQLDGVVAGRRVLNAQWVRDSSRPDAEFLHVGRLPSTITTHAGFGWHWWPLQDRGERVTADGSRGQFIYVDRPRRTVIVQTSRWPHADAAHDRACRDTAYLALPSIAAAATEPISAPAPLEVSAADSHPATGGSQ